MQGDPSLINEGKDKQKSGNSNVFGFLDCKKLEQDDDSSMQGDGEYEKSVNESAIESEIPPNVSEQLEEHKELK